MIFMSYGEKWVITRKRRSSKFIPFIMKEISYCSAKRPTKDQVRKYKRKIGQQIDDTKRGSCL